MLQRQLDFKEAVERALKVNYCNFKGRASRSEYWWFALFCSIVSFVFSFVGNMCGHTAYMVLMLIYFVAFFLPSLSICVRRLHDINKSGWWYLIGLIPLVGIIILIVWFVKESDNVPNQYGPVPNLVG